VRSAGAERVEFLDGRAGATGQSRAAIRQSRGNTVQQARPTRTSIAARTRRLLRDALRRDPDDRWAAVFGRIAGYSFAVAAVTGVLLLPFFRPSMAPVAYHGSRPPETT
jgi:hypothetical protein